MFDILEIGDLHLQRSAQVHVRAGRGHESDTDTDMLQGNVLGPGMAGHRAWVGSTAGVSPVFRWPASVQALFDEGRHHTRMANTRFLVLLIRTVDFAV